ncbi:hypothetical protein [uncultured Methanobacterium sp.]|uniref:hypothetical protein n=1 Tax=uncultured Methanobacterium sp. TaxID=176306 RepID=UPI002AA67205|nr:hypothetical protein [uncultured Methanobacterium sp.]
MKIPKKAALICALVMMISVVPAFALNQTDNTTTDQTQGQNCTGNQNQHKYQGSQGSCDSAGENCGSCDGDQHQYQYGQKNSASGASNCDQDHQYGQGNSNSGTGICDGTNCKKTS